MILSVKMFTLFFLVLLLSSGALCDNITYIFGIPKNYQQSSTNAKIIISTTAEHNVSFTVLLRFDEISDSGYVNTKNPVHITIPHQFIANNYSYANRYKAIAVKTSEDVSVTALNSLFIPNAGASTGVFRVLPHQNLLVKEYEYFAVSSKSPRPDLSSLLLLVGCEDRTVIDIKPSVNVLLPNDTQNNTSNVNEVKAGTVYKTILHRLQTLLISSPGGDLSGTQVISDKPLSVISGHECANVPENIKGCDQILTQVPPTVTWGKEFVLVPFEGRREGQTFKIVSAKEETVLRHGCSNVGTTSSINMTNSGDTFELHTSSYQTCHLMATKPILVAQFSLGYDTDKVGDPAVMIVPPFEQYVNEVTFTSLQSDDFSQQYITVVTLTQNFYPKSILLDNEPMRCEWILFFTVNYSSVLGYTCKLELRPGPHNIVHSEPNGKLAVMVYGFNSGDYKRQGYAYNTGLAMIPLNTDIKVNFTSTHYIVQENESVVRINLWRHEDLNIVLDVLVDVVDMNSLSGVDFQPLHEVVSFGVGEIHKDVIVNIINDEWVEPPEQFMVQLKSMDDMSIIRKATVTIKDDDIINIGFIIPNNTTISKTDVLQVATLNGILQSNVLVKMDLSVAFISGHLNMTSQSHHITISDSNNNVSVPILGYNMSTPVTVLGILTIADNKSSVYIKLYPSVILLDGGAVSMSRKTYQSTSTIVAATPPLAISIHTQINWDNIIVAVIVTCVTTTLIAIIICTIGCYVVYKRKQKCIQTTVVLD